MALPTLFAATAGVFVFNGVHSIVGMVPLPFLLQRGVQFVIGVGVVTHHFPVLKLMQEWGIKNEYCVKLVSFCKLVNNHVRCLFCIHVLSACV